MKEAFERALKAKEAKEIMKEAFEKAQKEKEAKESKKHKAK